MRRFVYILRTCQGGKFVVVPGTHVYRQSLVFYKVPVTSSECPMSPNKQVQICLSNSITNSHLDWRWNSACLKHVPVFDKECRYV